MKGSSSNLAELIQNETLFNTLEFKSLMSALRKTKLSVDQANYILQNGNEHYDIEDLFNILQHMNIEFYENEKPILDKILIFFALIHDNLKVRCFKHIYNITKTIFNDYTSYSSKNTELNNKISEYTSKIADLEKENQSLKEKLSTETKNTPPQAEETKNTDQKKTMQRTQTTYKIKTFKIPSKPAEPSYPEVNENRNIELLKKTEISCEKFDRIYKIFEKIARENDKDAMHYAVQNKYDEVINRMGHSVLTWSADKNNLPLAMMLVEVGVDPFQKKFFGATALNKFCTHGNLEAVKYFTSIPRADPNSPDLGGVTTLQKAAFYGFYDICEYLLTCPGIKIN